MLFRTPIYYGQVPSLGEFALSGAIASVALIVGWLFFTSKADEFAYRV
jgi:ABC-type polysaccharide/polyol phosphate export permease